VCRAGFHGGFEIAAHAGRQPAGTGVVDEEVPTDRGQLRERLCGVAGEWRDGHQAAQPQHPRTTDSVGQRGEPAGLDAGPMVTAGRVEADLEEYVDGT
jgi:hypothetical protein